MTPRWLKAAVVAVVLAACSGPVAEDAAATAVQQQIDTIPLKPGYYVAVDTPCSQASNATVSLFKGDGFSAWCETRSIEKTGPTTYRLVQACTDPRDPEPFETDALYELKGDSAYVETGDGWQREARFCPQSQMSEPFNTNDISEFTN